MDCPNQQNGNQGLTETREMLPPYKSGPPTQLDLITSSPPRMEAYEARDDRSCPSVSPVSRSASGRKEHAY